MQAATSGELPHALDHVEFRAVRRQILDLEFCHILFPPFLMQLGMVVSSVVQNKDHFSLGSRADASNVLEEREECFSVERTVLTLIGEFPVAQSHGSEVPGTFSRWMMEENRIFKFGRNPHSTR